MTLPDAPRTMLSAACVVMLVFCASCASIAERPPPALKVMAFNVRLPTDADGANRWDARRGIAVRMLREADADLIGTQELHRRQGDEIVAALPQYRWFGRGRAADGGGEYMGVFYRTDRLRVLESGDFWLSDTPAVPGSISWGNLFPRMVTWARFERIADGRRFTLFNTHLPYRAEDEAARLRGARLIRARIDALPQGESVVVTGDLNTAPDGAVHAALVGEGALRDAWQAAAVRSGPEGTFHAFTGKAERRIDWILVRGFDVRAMRTIDTEEGGRYPSDHFPVVAELAFP
jgi:endonuclease/exonuclease/phosphatase family metal-dependent hydrolase